MSQSHSWDPCTSWVLVLLGLAEGNRAGKGPRLSSKVESEKGSHICKLKESREKHSALRKTVEKKDMEGKGQKKNHKWREPHTEGAVTIPLPQGPSRANRGVPSLCSNHYSHPVAWGLTSQQSQQKAGNRGRPQS